MEEPLCCLFKVRNNMPALNIFTNISRNKIPKDFMKNVLPVLSKSVKKPEEVFVISISPDCLQNVEGDEVTPSVIASLHSIGHVSPEYTRVIARDLSAYIEETLGVQKNRIFLWFGDVKPHEVAKSGITIDILEGK